MSVPSQGQYVPHSVPLTLRKPISPQDRSRPRPLARPVLPGPPRRLMSASTTRPIRHSIPLSLSIVARPHGAGLISSWRADSQAFVWLDPRSELAPHYSLMGRPSIDPELMIRMLVVGYVFAIRSERLICREVQVNLAYRWFCRVGIEDAIPDHSAFSRARNERFREGDVFRRVFERVVETCIAAGLV